MSIFDLTHFLTLIFYLTAMQSMGTYPSGIVEVHSIALVSLERGIVMFWHHQNSGNIAVFSAIVRRH